MERSKAIRLLAIFVLVLMVCSAAFAEDEQESSAQAKKEVLTGLGQRMLKRVSVDFRNMQVEDAIRLMADQADVDIILSPDVVGTVTATLTNVPLEEALSNILAAHGYGYVASENMLRIAPLEQINKTQERLVSRIYRITYADVKEVEAALKQFIGTTGSLSSNLGTSNIIVTAPESKIKAIDTFISEIDRITPQVLVEARIYDITSTDRFDLGVQWQVGRNTSYAGATTTYGTSGIASPGSTDASNRTDPFMTGLFGGAASESADAVGSLRWGWLNDSIDIDVMLKAQQEGISAKLLANPRILVLDNEPAIFNIVTEIPYVELSDAFGGGTISTVKFKTSGVKLNVTPHLTREEMIKLHLLPSFSVQTSQVTLSAGSGTYQVPVVDVREADTKLLIKSGQTVVLGGLRKKETKKTTNKVPLLGDLPLIGNIFKAEAEDTVNSELVVFITPSIVEKPEMTETELLQYKETDFEGPEPEYTRAEE
jgi:type IV pilus assembly protein PilQ